MTRTFTSKDGTVRTRDAGTGADLVIFNPNHPDVTIPLKGNGSLTWTTPGPDGSSTITATGHNVFVFFPTDTLLGNTPGLRRCSSSAAR